MSDSLFRRTELVGRPRRSVKTSPKELDKLTNLICSIQQGLDPRVVKALIERMHG